MLRINSPALSILLLVSGALGEGTPAALETVRVGISTDVHLRPDAPQNRRYLEQFVIAMSPWRPDFVVDLGDFGVQVASGNTTAEAHAAQLQNLADGCSVLAKLACPRYFVIGNHDAGWIQGGDEAISWEALCRQKHGGEHITKREWADRTGMPGRFYSFDVKGVHFLVLDGNNARGPAAVAAGHDGVPGAYWIDDAQKRWVAGDLAAHRGRRTVVFCHAELHHTPPRGSGEGGEVPFPAIGKDASYVDNGWELRKLFAEEGNVVVCFFGHKHRGRWTVYGGVHYMTLAALHSNGSYAKVTISDKRLCVEGASGQSPYTVPVSDNPAPGRSTLDSALSPRR
jgi:hypothetical protein